MNLEQSEIKRLKNIFMNLEQSQIKRLKNICLFKNKWKFSVESV